MQGLPGSQVAAAPTAQLSQQQQQMLTQQQQQAQQLLQQQLQQLKAPATSGNHTIAINKPQVVSFLLHAVVQLKKKISCKVHRPEKLCSLKAHLSV